MQDPRERGVSRRFSEAVTANDQLDNEDAILHLMFPQEVRMTKVKGFAAWGIINAILAIYIIILLVEYKEHWDHACIG